MESDYDDHYWEDHEVDGIGGNDYNCRNCGGYGHYARECPTKGKGKGKSFDKGKGKGFHKGKGDGGNAKGDGKGWGKPMYNYDMKGGKGDYAYGLKGKGIKGKGKGYQGTCWNCGKVEHEASECNVRGAWLIEEEEEEQVEGVGGVWEV